MLRNYLTTAWRDLLRQRLYSVINITGLSMAMAFCLLAFRYFQYERGYDDFHDGAERIHLIRFRTVLGAGSEPTTITPHVLAPTVQSHLSGVEQVTRLHPIPDCRIRHGESTLVRRGAHADPNVLDVFAFPVLAGDPQNAIGAPGSIIITSRLAEELLGDMDPMGEIIAVDDGWRPEQDFAVVGVIDIPENSNVQVDFLLPMAAVSLPMSWGNWRVYTFAKLKEGATAPAFEARLAAFLPRHLESTGVPEAGRVEADVPVQLLPLKELHLMAGNVYPFADLTTAMPSRIIAAIAVVVLFVACANFANLTIAIVSTRARETGVRKAAGATRLQVLWQFWWESLLLIGLALPVAVTLAELALPRLNAFAQRQMTLEVAGSWVVLAGVAAAVGLVTGSYPAAVLSRCPPASVLRGRFRISGSGRLGRILVASQFSISIALIASSLLVARQLEHLRTKDQGFRPEQLVIVDAAEDAAARTRYFRLLQQEAQSNSRLVSVSIANMLYGAGHAGFGADPGYQGSSLVLDDGRRIHGARMYVGDDFLRTTGMELAAGRDLEPGSAADAAASTLVNEAFLRELGLEDVLGTSPGLPAAQRVIRGKTVVGVVRDFHLARVKERIGPAAIHLRSPETELRPGFKADGRLRYVLVRISPDDVAETVSLLRQKWEEAATSLPFSYSFADDNLARSLRDEARWLVLSRWSTGLAVLIAALGVFGLSAMAAERRTREMGVRKVLGADTWSVAVLLLGQVGFLMVAASAIAWPAAYYGLSRWLAHYPYRIDVGIDAFALATGGSLALAWASAGWHTARAALANPVEALRCE